MVTLSIQRWPFSFTSATLLKSTAIPPACLPGLGSWKGKVLTKLLGFLPPYAPWCWCPGPSSDELLAITCWADKRNTAWQVRWWDIFTIHPRYAHYSYIQLYWFCSYNLISFTILNNTFFFFLTYTYYFKYNTLLFTTCNLCIPVTCYHFLNVTTC